MIFEKTKCDEYGKKKCVSDAMYERRIHQQSLPIICMGRSKLRKIINSKN